MVVDPYGRAVTCLGRLVGDGTETLTDADLLRRFVSSRDGIAFAAIVRRHGPMVFGVCRRTLGNMHDAEDAFQATFVVLARRASIVKPDGISRWLYGVAVRVANKSRVRRIRHCSSSAGLADCAASPEREPADWLPKLDEALARLSDRDRRPILLCDLAGRSRAEAAAELGIAEGTLSSRLARAREKLRRKLGRLGVSLSLAQIIAGLTDEASATMPGSLIETTRSVAKTVPIQTLAEGVVRGMALANFTKWSAIGLCLMGTLTVGAIWLPIAGADPQAGGKDAAKSVKPATPQAEATTDADRIRGTWIVESRKPSIESARGKGAFGGGGGDAFSGANWEGRPMTFDGDRVDFAGFDGQNHRFRLDQSASPKRMDFVSRNVGRGFQRKDGTLPSIYRFVEDKLHIVLGDEDLMERPDSFEPSSKSPFVSLVLRRPSADERTGLQRSILSSLQGTWVSVRRTINGEPMQPDGAKFVVKGDRVRYDLRSSDPIHATFDVNFAASPSEITLTATSDSGGVKKGQELKGIVYMQSDQRHQVGNVLMLSLATPVGSPRPTNFDDAGDKKGLVYVDVFSREGASSSVWSDFVGGEPAKASKKEPKKVENTKLRKLQEARIEALKTQLQGQFERVKIGKDPLIQYLDAIRELCEAELEYSITIEAKQKAVESAFKELKDTEELMTQLQEAGLQTKQGMAQVKAARLKYEIELEKLKSAK